ncbi:hypothetical protein PRIPAC_94129 [Pristionchus pacificus]|uniref:Uncharacterized protein n=1 Tax=Pristionchus pacificus TaxID=54126 RepID=A0A2A6BR34_PRIPA|nr:hypothetical protein PRIPAC_94129 [Pristionchus pacificus]|eukprot:PDM68379.1 hypothetical protein PRIPAC_46423 [Pristionchus pacificus]
MRPEAAFDPGTTISSGLSLLFLLVLPLSALAFYCGGKAQASAEKGSAVNTSDKSAKSKTVSKSTIGSSGNAAVPDGSGGREAVAKAGEDYRPQWVTALLETQTPMAISKEFMAQLKDYSATGRTCISFEANTPRNRYADIPCFDQDRIILKGPTDYINANYMKAPDGVTYIATQGPLTETRSEFWQMVVQEEAVIILQLCKNIEGDTEKCSEYWPNGEKDTIALDKLTVRRLEKSEEIAPGTIRTKLRIEGKTTNRSVQHIFCDSWPDKLAPSDPATIIKIWNYVKANRGSGPIVVHCSAGVGRTATFIGLSYGVEMLKKQGATVIDVVKELRKCRQKAVQTHIQYVFLHAALLEMFLQMNLSPRSPQATAFMDAFRRQVERSMEKKEKTEKSINSGEVKSPPCKK